MFDVHYLYPDHNKDMVRSSTELIIEEQFDAIFHVSFNEELDLPEQAAKMAMKKDIPVIQWDCDSSWRFPNWVLPRKDRVTHFITTHSSAIQWYKRYGMNVTRSQWGGSPVYKPQDLEQEYDVTFIGQKHGQMPNGQFVRAEIIDKMMEAGINVQLFGNYWDGYDNWHGYVTSFEQMLDVFSKSKICLNLSNPWHFGTMPQIKGRHFEIPQMRRLQLTTPADDLESYFEEDKEIVIARSTEEIIEKCKYYLEHKEARDIVAQAGYDRNQKDHQWRNRFKDIFEDIGLL